MGADRVRMERDCNGRQEPTLTLALSPLRERGSLDLVPLSRWWVMRAVCESSARGPRDVDV